MPCRLRIFSLGENGRNSKPRMLNAENEMAWKQIGSRGRPELLLYWNSPSIFVQVWAEMIYAKKFISRFSSASLKKGKGEPFWKLPRRRFGSFMKSLRGFFTQRLTLFKIGLAYRQYIHIYVRVKAQVKWKILFSLLKRPAKPKRDRRKWLMISKFLPVWFLVAKCIGLRLAENGKW